MPNRAICVRYAHGRVRRPAGPSPNSAWAGRTLTSTTWQDCYSTMMILIRLRRCHGARVAPRTQQA